MNPKILPKPDQLEIAKKLQQDIATLIKQAAMDGLVRPLMAGVLEDTKLAIWTSYKEIGDKEGSDR